MLKRVLIVALFMFSINALFGPVQSSEAGITLTGDIPPVTSARGGPYPPRPEPPWHPTWKPEGRWRGPCEGWWLGENLTLKTFNANPARGITMMQRLIVCVFAIWAPGQSTYALVIADRESGFSPYAYNPSGASGLFQHMIGYWPARAAAIPKKLFAPGAQPLSPFDPRANAIATAMAVAANGWGAWTTA